MFATIASGRCRLAAQPRAQRRSTADSSAGERSAPARSPSSARRPISAAAASLARTMRRPAIDQQQRVGYRGDDRLGRREPRLGLHQPRVVPRAQPQQTRPERARDQRRGRGVGGLVSLAQSRDGPACRRKRRRERYRDQHREYQGRRGSRERARYGQQIDCLKRRQHDHNRQPCREADAEAAEILSRHRGFADRATGTRQSRRVTAPARPARS